MNHINPDKSSVHDNRFLRCLLARGQKRFISKLDPCDLSSGEVLVGADEPIQSVYFPSHCIVSQLIAMDGCKNIEVDTVGNEGLVGLPAFLDGDQSLRSVVQVPGLAFRMDAASFRQVVAEDVAVRRLAYRYTLAKMHQLSQSVACNALHDVRQRLCRWLLTCHDRLGNDEIPLTQHFLSQMLGVRRATVSDVAARLQLDGLIRYQRGRLTIKDRAGMEKQACECYRAVKKRYDALLA